MLAFAKELNLKLVEGMKASKSVSASAELVCLRTAIAHARSHLSNEASTMSLTILEYAYDN